jgi:hypothetical protein
MVLIKSYIYGDYEKVDIKWGISNTPFAYSEISCIIYNVH